MPGSADLYYIGYTNDNALFGTQAGDELRHTLGTRYFGRKDGLDWNWEGFLQLGEFEDQDILAWSLGTETGYTFAQLPLSPRVATRLNFISGDTNPDDDKLGTFNAMFPRGGYFGDIGVVGPSNLINVHPSLDLTLARGLTLTMDCVFFWRYSDDDAIYSAAGIPIRQDGNSDSSYVGTQPSLILTYRPTDQLWIIGTYSAFIPGDFIEDTGASETIHYVRLEAGFRF